MPDFGLVRGQIPSFGPAVTHTSTFQSFCSGQTVPCASSFSSCGCLSYMRWNSLLQILQRCLTLGEFLHWSFWKEEFLGYEYDAERTAAFPIPLSVSDTEIILSPTIRIWMDAIWGCLPVWCARWEEGRTCWGLGPVLESQQHSAPGQQEEAGAGLKHPHY